MRNVGLLLTLFLNTIANKVYGLSITHQDEHFAKTYFSGENVFISLPDTKGHVRYCHHWTPVVQLCLPPFPFNPFYVSNGNKLYNTVMHVSEKNFFTACVAKILIKNK